MSLKKSTATDASAALVSAIVALLGATGTISRLGLTADDVAAILGALLTLAAAGRAYLGAR